LEQIVRSRGIPQALYVDRHGIFQQTTESAHAPHPRGGTGRRSRADPGRAGARRTGHRAHRCSQSPGEGAGRTALGHPPGPTGRGARRDGGDDPPWRQPLPPRLSPPPQRPLRRARRRPRPCLPAGPGHARPRPGLLLQTHPSSGRTTPSPSGANRSSSWRRRSGGVGSRHGSKCRSGSMAAG
jgi:hypothetical protein